MISLRKINNNIENAKQLILDIEELKISIQDKEEELMDLEITKQTELTNQIESKKKKINLIKKYTNKIYDWNKKNVIENFIDETKIVSNKNFKIDKRKGILIPESISTNIEVSRIQKNDKNIIFSFDDKVTINSILYEFTDLNNLPLLPSAIRLVKDNVNLGFYENFMRFYDKNTIADDFTTQTNLSPKEVNQIVFEFDKPYNQDNVLVNFENKVFKQNCEIVYKFTNVFEETLEINTNCYDKFFNIIIKYSFDGSNYKEVTDSIITNQISSFVFVKITTEPKNDIPNSEKKEIKYLKEFIYDSEVDDNIYIQPENYIILPSDSYNIILTTVDEKIKKFTEPFNKFVNKISNKFIIKKDVLSDINKDYISLFSNYYKNNEEIELVFYQVGNKLYIPEELISKILIRYEEKANNEKDVSENYFPIIFDFTLKG